MKGKKPLRVIVTAKTGNLGQLASQLKQSGMRIDSLLDAVGIATGEIDVNHLSRLRRVPGITIEEDKPVQIPAPDSPVQ